VSGKDFFIENKEGFFAEDIFEMAPVGYSGARGKLIHEKN
jgi:hypothetical protein